MAQVRTQADDTRLIEPKAERVAVLRRRLEVLELLVRALEDELSDDELSDDQKLQNIGERVAAVMDGR